MILRILLFASLLTACQSEPNREETRLVVASSPEVIPEEAPSQSVDSSLIDPTGQTILTRIRPPAGFRRITYEPGTFEHYLQHLPLKAAGSKVFLYNGQEKRRQDVHAAVLDIDVGKRDLQQCADAVIRLRAEFLWQAKRYEDIQFQFTNGFTAPYARWRSGERIRVRGNEVNWFQQTSRSESYEDFRRYLTMVFSYAGTLSLAKELPSKDVSTITTGDVFIQGGSPGHAIIVVDQAIQAETGELMVLLAQSYMPAQDIHILQNFGDPHRSPWYAVKDFAAGVLTPEWRFSAADLKSF